MGKLNIWPILILIAVIVVFAMVYYGSSVEDGFDESINTPTPAPILNKIILISSN